MKSLDDQIADIEKLDELRRDARKLLQEAIEVLTAGPYRPKPRPGSRDRKKAMAAWKESKRNDWEMPGDEIEKAQVLHALRLARAKKDDNPGRQKDSEAALIRDLDAIRYADFDPVTGSDDEKPLDHIPVLRAAYVLQALAGVPGKALSKAALSCFCRIVQELNEIVDPTWAAGAARGDEKSVATAFVTGECARALLRFEAALSQTMSAAELLGEAAAREADLASRDDRWSVQEKTFRRYSLNISLAALPQLVINVERDAADSLRESSEAMLNRIDKVVRTLPAASAIMGPRPVAPAAPKTDGLREIVSVSLAHAAKVIAWDALNQLHQTLTAAVADTDPARRGRKIAAKLRNGAQLVRDLLRPMEQFAESTIDRQIAAASPYLSVPVDGAELVFAATLFGSVTNWKRPKVRAAYDVLAPLLSSNGRLLSIRPFDVGSDGYRLNVATLEVTRRLATLVGNLDVEPEPEFVGRLMLPFEYTRVPGDRAKSGWTSDPPPREPKSLWWLTAIAVDALASMIHMLDKTINRRVLRQFHVRYPETLSLKLDALFYPDYGLPASYGKKPRSVAIELQQLRAHAGNGPAEKEPGFSLILYGPPGTGKTTLVEAVAATAGVPLVEITPSDILVGGAEGIERRARQVFQALSKLTHVVILFDEFEQILLDRTRRAGKIPTSVIEFLTPGMLPKLKTLYDASKTGRMSFVLATNLLDSVDDAVKREGRFDRKSGLYPPDVISRLGRLRDQVNSFVKKREEQYLKEKDKLQALPKAARKAALKALATKIAENKKIATDAGVRARILAVVKRTGGGPMSTLGQPGWFTMPESEEKANTKPFGFILNAARGFEDIEAEAKYDSAKAAEEAKDKPSGYWGHWTKIRAADENCKGLSDDKTVWKDLVVPVDKLLKAP
jgi:adenylate kinase family enzyme